MCKFNDKVSVIVPIFNVEQFLRQCINSLILQSYSNIEIILVNDGCTDGCYGICEDYKQIDSRIKVIHKVNGGLSEARNTGVQAATGDYLYFLDSDDMIIPNAIELLINQAKMNDLQLILFDANVINEDGSYCNQKSLAVRYHRTMDYSGVFTGPALFAKMIKYHEYYSCVPLLFIKRNAFKYSFVHILHEDELFTIQLLYSVDRAMCIAEPLYLRRIRSGSITTTSKSIRHYDGMCQVIWGLIKIENFDNMIVRYICTLYQWTTVIYHNLLQQDKAIAKTEKRKLKEMLRLHQYFYSNRLRLVCTFSNLYPVYNQMRNAVWLIKDNLLNHSVGKH